jgi:hypothetical protein
MALTSQGKLFRYDSNGKRVEITKRAEAAEVWTIACLDAASITAGDYFRYYSANDATLYTVWYKVAGAGSAPVVSGATAVEVAVGGADTAAQVATATQTALDALSAFVATVNSTTVTSTAAAVGDSTGITDVNTGFTFTCTTQGTGPATAISGTLTSCDMKTFNNRLFFTMSGVGNTPKQWYAEDATDTWEDVYGAPDASILGEYQGRLLMNSKTDKDRAYYSPPYDHTLWQGTGDSGAARLPAGDGDPEGITAFANFKTRLIVSKAGRIFKLEGDDITTDPFVAISNGIGVIGNKALATVDLDDVVYVSRRGIHSLVATDTTGEFSGNFLSLPIQSSFNDWEMTRLKYTQVAYIPPLNSVAFTVAEDGDSQQSAIWLLNVNTKAWYRWPNMDAQSLASFIDPSSGVVRLMAGTDDGRLMVSQRGSYTDFSTTPINFRIKSGSIYVDGNPQTQKMFKKLTLLFRPQGAYSFTVYFKVDNFPVQALVYSQTTDTDDLGSTFTLGTSLLGNNAGLAPFSKQVMGIGRGCSIEVFQTGVEGQVEIYGYMIEYELADLADEVQ